MKTIKLLVAACAAVLLACAARAYVTIDGTTPIHNYSTGDGGIGVTTDTLHDYPTLVRIDSKHTFSARLSNVPDGAGYAWYYKADDERNITGTGWYSDYCRVWDADGSKSYTYTCKKWDLEKVGVTYTYDEWKPKRELWLVVYDTNTVDGTQASAPWEHFSQKIRWNIEYVLPTADERLVTVKPDTLKEWVIGVPMTQTITVGGDYNFTSGSFGELPDGITGSFDASTRTYTMSGTPTKAGSLSYYNNPFSFYLFKVGTYPKRYNVTVRQGAYVVRREPSGEGFSFDTGSTHDFSVTLGDEVFEICYKWYLTDDSGVFQEIPGATEKSYTYVHPGGSRKLKFVACSSVNGYEFCSTTWGGVNTASPRVLSQSPSASEFPKMKVGETKDFSVEMINATRDTTYTWEVLTSSGERIPLTATGTTCSYTYDGTSGQLYVTVLQNGSTVASWRWQNIITIPTVASPTPADTTAKFVEGEEQEFSLSVAGTTTYNVTWTFTDKAGNAKTLATTGTSYKFTFDGTEGELKATVSNSNGSDEHVWQIVKRIPYVGGGAPKDTAQVLTPGVPTQFQVYVYDWTDDAGYRWYLVDGAGVETAIVGATEDIYTYTQGSDDVTLKVVVYSKSDGRTIFGEREWTITAEKVAIRSYSPYLEVSLENGEKQYFTIFPEKTSGIKYKWYTGDAEGKYTLVSTWDSYYYTHDGVDKKIKVEYLAGTGYVYGSLEWTVTTKTGPTAPTIKGETTHTDSMTVGESKDFTVELNNPDSVKVSYAWVSSDGATGTDATFNFAPRTAGRSTVTCMVTSEDGRTTYGTVTWTIIVESAAVTAPTIKGETTRTDSMTVGESKDLTVELNNPDSVKVAYVWTSSDGAASTEETFSYTPRTAGTTTVTCTIMGEDGTEYGKVEWSIVVGEAASLTRVTPSEENLEVEVGQTQTFTAQANGFDASEMRVSWTSYLTDPNTGDDYAFETTQDMWVSEEGLTATFEIQGTETYLIECDVYGTDGTGYSVKWYVTGKAPAVIPGLTRLSPAEEDVTNKVNVTTNFMVNAVGIDAAKLAWSWHKDAIGIPLGVVTESDGTSYSFMTPSAGSYTITCTGSDDAGTEYSASWNLTVEAATRVVKLRPGAAIVQKMSLAKGAFRQKIALANGKAIKSMRILSSAPVVKSLKSMSVKAATASSSGGVTVDGDCLEGEMTDDLEGEEIILEVTDEDDEIHTMTLKFSSLSDTKAAKANAAPYLAEATPSENAVECYLGESYLFTVDALDEEGDTLTYTWYLDDVQQTDFFLHNGCKSCSFYDDDAAHEETIRVLSCFANDGNGETLIKTWQITLVDPPFAFKTTALPDGAVGESAFYETREYLDEQLILECGIRFYVPIGEQLVSIEKTKGVIPPGMVIMAAEEKAAGVYGVYRNFGEFEFTLKATCSNGETAEQTFKVKVTGSRSAAKIWHVDPENTLAKSGASDVENVYPSLIEALMSGMAEGDTVYLYPAYTQQQDSKGLALLKYIDNLNVIVTNGTHRVLVVDPYIPDVSNVVYTAGGRFSFQLYGFNYENGLDYGTFVPVAFVGTDKDASDYDIEDCTAPYCYDAPSIDENGYLGFRIGVSSDGTGGYALNFADDVNRRTATFSNTYLGDLTVTSSESALDASVEFGGEVGVGNLTVKDGVKTVVKAGATLVLQPDCEMDVASGGIAFEAGSTLVITPGSKSLLICNRTMTLPETGKVTLRVDGSMVAYRDLVIAARYVGPNDPTEKFDLVAPTDGLVYRLVLGSENTLVLTTKVEGSDGDPGALNWEADDANLNTKAGSVKAFEPFSYTFGVTGSEADRGSETGDDITYSPTELTAEATAGELFTQEITFTGVSGMLGANAECSPMIDEAGCRTDASDSSKLIFTCTPPSSGTYAVTIHMFYGNSDGTNVKQFDIGYTLNVKEGATSGVTLTPATLPDATVGTAYTATLTLEGASIFNGANLRWSPNITDGSITARYNKTAQTIVISGTPTTAQKYTLTAIVYYNSDGSCITQTFELNVNAASESSEEGTDGDATGTGSTTRSAASLMATSAADGTTTGEDGTTTGEEGATTGSSVYSYELVGEAYSVTRTGVSTFDANAGTQELLQGAYRVDGDEGGAPVDLGFAFPANGTYYSKLQVGSGGYLYLGGDQVAICFLEKGLLPELNLTLDNIYIIRGTGSLGVRYGSFGTVTFYDDGKIRFAYGPDADLRSSQNEIPICRISAGTSYQEYASKTGTFAGEGDALFTPDGVPQGLSFDGATLSGTVNLPGTYSFKVKVTDVCGKTLTKAFTLTVEAGDGAMPVIESATGPQAGEDGNIHLLLGESADFEATSSSGTLRWTVDGIVQSTEDPSKFTLIAPSDRPLDADHARIHEVAVEAETADLKHNWAVRKVWYVVYNRSVYIDANVNLGDDDPTGPKIESDGLTPSTAYPTYWAEMFAYLLNGDEVILASGTYTEPLDFGDNTAKVTVRGSEGTVVEITSPNTRCFRQVQSQTVIGRTKAYEVIAMPCRNAEVSGITFAGGNIETDTFDNKYNNNEGASIAYYGIVGGGAFGGSFSNCVFTGCNSAGYGGGAYGATMTHCVVENCSSAIGGGCANCALENCTIVYNAATSKAGGIDGQCSATKCIILGNEAAGEANDWAATITPVHLDPYVPTLNDCFLTGDGDPKFCADYYLGVGSDAEGKGAHPIPSATASCFVDVQIVGAGELEPFDSLVANGGSVTFTAKGRDVTAIKVNGVSVEPSNPYVLTDVTRNTTVVFTFEAATITVGAGKDYETIAEAIWNAGTGDTIVVDDGTYGPIDVSAFDGTLTIEAAENATPVIDGGNMGRCVIAKPGAENVVIRGITMINGLALHESGDQPHPNGLHFLSNAQLLALGVGGGVFGGAYENCVISNCVAQGAMGGGAYGAKLVNCTIANNVAGQKDDNTYLIGAWGGGVYGGSLNDCRVNGNILRMAKPSAICSGAGTYDAEVRNSYVWGNTIDCGQYAGEEPSNCEAGENGLVIQTSERVPTTKRLDERKTPVAFDGTGTKYATEAVAQTAAAKQTVEIPTAVARVIPDQDAYVAKFTVKSVQQRDGSYVNKPVIKDEVKEEIFETELKTALTKDDNGNDRTEFNVQRMDRTLTETTPGLYYALEFATSLGSDSNFNGERHLSDGGSVKLSATSIDSPSGFWRVNVYATPDGE